MTLLEITLTLPPNQECTVHFKVDPGATGPSLTTSTPPSPSIGSSGAVGGGASGAATWPVGVERMLVRFEKSPKTKKWPHRSVAAHLLAAGFEPEPPETGTRPYVRWTVYGTVRPVTVYQEGSGIVVDSHPVLAFVLTLPGSNEPAGKHPKVKWHYSASMDNALNAITQLRAHADAS